MSVLIRELKKNNSEIIKIEISEFEGRELINIRIWYRSKQIDQETGDYIYKPTQKGISLDISKFQELKEGIDALGNYLNDREKDKAPDQPE
jgi:phosphomannomutase